MPQPNRTEEKVVWRSLGERGRHPEEQGMSGITLKICCRSSCTAVFCLTRLRGCSKNVQLSSVSHPRLDFISSGCNTVLKLACGCHSLMGFVFLRSL